MLLDIARYAYVARLGETLHARGNIDAVAKKIVAIDHHIPEADPNADDNSPVLRHIRVEAGHCALDINSLPDCIYLSDVSAFGTY